jgi:hypothetical protein
MNIRIEFGKPYRGFGAADPSKTRDEREEELHYFMGQSFGLDLLAVLASQGSSHPLFQPPPVGTTGSHLIGQILKHEYPNG